MGRSTIPVDLLNPGQVFACLGLMEVAEVLLGEAEGGFQWGACATPAFVLQALGDIEPVQHVFERLAKAKIKEVEPRDWPGEHAPGALVVDRFPSPMEDHQNEKRKWTRTALPFAIEFDGEPGCSLTLGNWCDGSTRPRFKLYSGNRSAFDIARDMLRGKRDKAGPAGQEGKLLNRGLCQLWDDEQSKMKSAPLEVICALAGRFGFDPRGGWEAIDAGFSPDRQKSSLAGVAASPVVELLARWGVEHARPQADEDGVYRYAVWQGFLPAMLARAVLFGSEVIRPLRRFRYRLGSSGENKLVMYATEEKSP